MPVAEPQQPAAPEHLQVDEMPGAEHIGVRQVCGRASPPHGVDLGEQCDPDLRGQVRG